MEPLDVFKHADKQILTAAEYLQISSDLEALARESINYDTSTCTFDQGHIKQAVFSCLTCQKENGGQLAGICASCSVQCHSTHDQVELFDRRHFQCDCGTTRIGEEAACNLGKRLGQVPNEGNRYDGNFKNIFCICGRDYDPHTEQDEMVQCITCENWLHSNCFLPKVERAFDLDDFDTLICSTCASSDKLKAILDRYAGKENTGVVVLDSLGNPHGKLKEEPEEDSKKREREPDDADAEEPHKKSKLDEEPVGSALEQATLPESPAAAETTKVGPAAAQDNKQGACSASDAAPSSVFAQAKTADGFKATVFLQGEDWRDRWCRCKECLPLFKDFSYLLEEEESYEPPEEAEVCACILADGQGPATWFCTVTTEAVNAAATQKLMELPRGPVLDYLRNMKSMEEALHKWLQARAESTEDKDKVITGDMIKDFMQSLRSAQ